VFVFQRDGRFLRTIGTDVLDVPTGIWMDKSSGILYVADWWKGQVLKFDREGRVVGTIGTQGHLPGQLSGPKDVVIHGDRLVVLDSYNSRFSFFDLHGNFRAVQPFGVNRTPVTFAFDRNEHLFFVDLDSGGVVATDPQGNVLANFAPRRTWGQWMPGANKGTNFTSLTTDAKGDILVLRSTFNLETLELPAVAQSSTP
jgi:sugar lactone lactonase YvrE